MDKIFDQLLKHLPSELIPFALGIAATFLGIYYYKGYRNYTDTIHDRAFLTTIVVISGFFLLYVIHKSRDPAPQEVTADATPFLVVPEFENDERGQFKAIFVQQLQAAMYEVTERSDTILQINSFLADKESALLTAERYKAFGVLYAPKITRVGEKTFVFFTLLLVDPPIQKPYPPASVEEKQVLDNVVNTLTAAGFGATAVGQNPLVARIDALERRVADLQATLYGLSASLAQTDSSWNYDNKYAIVVGINEHRDNRLPKLQFGVSDAEGMATVLKNYGY